MSTIDNVIDRLQEIILELTSEDIRNAPSFPPEDLNVLPQSVAYNDGAIIDVSAQQVIMKVVIRLEVYVNRNPLKLSLGQINNIAVELSRRLGGDPSLNSTCSTIVFPISYTTFPAVYNRISSECISFSITVKIMESVLT